MFALGKPNAGTPHDSALRPSRDIGRPSLGRPGRAKTAQVVNVAKPDAAVNSVTTIEAPAPQTLRRPQPILPSSEVDTWTPADYDKLFRNYRDEEDYDVVDIEGTLPTDLEGTFYRNGPGIVAVLINTDEQVTLKDGEAHFRSRFVRTKVYEEEVAAERVLYRGFGSQKPGGVLSNMFDIRDKPVANTSMLEWGGKLYALWEAHNPFLLDPATLKTLGEETFGGALRDEQPFTAHPCYDRHTDRLVAFSNGIRHGEGKLHIWEIDRQNRIRQAVTHTVGLLPILYLHDFKVTRNWYLFHQAPLGLDTGNLFRYLAGQVDQTKQVFFDTNSKGKLWLVPRDGGPPQFIETEPLMIWHYGNAFEDDRGKIFVDASAMETFSFTDFDMRNATSFPESKVVRFEIDPEKKTARRSVLLPQSADFPQTNPEEQGAADYKYLYLSAAANAGSSMPFRRVMKLNVQNKKTDSWLAPDGCFIGEPIYANRGDPASAQSEDDGYVLCLMADTRAGNSSLLVFRAAEIAAGPICKLNLRKLLPIAFHCAWSQTAFR